MPSRSSLLALCLSGLLLPTMACAQDNTSAFDPLTVRNLGGRIQREADILDLSGRLLIQDEILVEGSGGKSLQGRGTGAKRSWGPEQLTGPPDAPSYGDSGNAWCSLTENGKQEWLLLEYAQSVRPIAIHIYENYYPGAVSKVTVFDPQGREVVYWSGRCEIPAKPTLNDFRVSVRMPYKITRVKIYLNSHEVPGWNEIDAVGLEDANGKMHWAAAALASSTYAEPEKPKDNPKANNTPAADAPLLQRILQLEAEIQKLRAENEELKRRLSRLQELDRP